MLIPGAHLPPLHQHHLQGGGPQAAGPRGQSSHTTAAGAQHTRHNTVFLQLNIFNLKCLCSGRELLRKSSDMTAGVCRWSSTAPS